MGFLFDVNVFTPGVNDPNAMCVVYQVVYQVVSRPYMQVVVMVGCGCGCADDLSRFSRFS